MSVTVSGGTINWLTGNDEAKTYTGTTTIAAHTTVTAAGPLTTGENSQIVLEDEDSVLNLDFSSGFVADNWTKGHTVSGAGKLAINAAGQTLAAGDVLTSLMTSEKALGTLALTSGILDVTSSQNATYLKKITLLEVADGAQLAVRSPGMQDNQAGLKLSLAGAGTGAAGSDTAAALFFGKRGSDSVAIGNVARDVTLAADATVYVEDTVTGTLAGAYASNGHTLTKTGDGTLQLNHLDTSGNNFAVEAGVLQYQGDADNTFASVTLKAGTALSFYNNVAPQHTQTVEQLSLLGDATLRAEWNSSIWKITSLLGEDKTLTIDAASASTVQQHFVIDGGAFSGQINVQQGAAAPERERHAIVTINDATALQGAIVNLLAPANDLSTVSFGVGGSADGTISIAGLNGVAGTDLVSSSAISGESAAPAPDGNSRTLEITGSGTDYAFAGSVGAHLTVAMNGAGTQTLSGALADGTHYLAKAGTLKIASASQTGSHRFTAQGGTLDMGGYTRANDAAGADSIVYESGTISNLTLGSGMELGAAESYTGAIRLGGTTVLAGGTMSFRLTNTHPTYEDLATSYTIANGGSISLASNGSTTMLTFIPVNKKLYPTTDENGKDYTLIANVGDTFGAAGEVDKDALGLDFNMSTSGRTHYTLKVVENDDGTKSLVLNVQGAAAELTWKGTSSSWNTAPDNLAWNNGTGDDSFLDDDYVIFGSLGSAQIIQIDEAGVRMGGMVVVGDTDYTFNGGA